MQNFGTTTLTISNEKLNGIMKIVQALEDSNILLNKITETIKNETKEQNWRFLGMLFVTLGITLSGNMLTGKGIIRAGNTSKIHFNSTPSFKKQLNTKKLSESTKIW